MIWTMSSLFSAAIEMIRDTFLTHNFYFATVIFCMKRTARTTTELKNFSVKTQIQVTNENLLFEATQLSEITEIDAEICLIRVDKGHIFFAGFWSLAGSSWFVDFEASG